MYTTVFTPMRYFLLCSICILATFCFIQTPHALADEKSEAQEYFDQGMIEYEKENFEKSHELLEKSAEMGHGDAQYQMGVLYYKGQGVAKDNEKAAFWYGKAAKQGIKNAQNSLGNLYDESKKSITENAGKASDWVENTASESYNQAKEFMKGFGSD